MPVLPRKALPVPPTGRGSAPGTQPTVPPEEGIAPIRAMSPTPSTPPPVPVPRPSTAKTQSADDLLIKPPAPRSPPAAYASPPPQRTPPATPPKRAPSATTPAAACAESLSSRAAPQPRHGSPVNAVATPPPMPPRPGACSPQSNSASVRLFDDLQTLIVRSEFEISDRVAQTVHSHSSVAACEWHCLCRVAAAAARSCRRAQRTR